MIHARDFLEDRIVREQSYTTGVDLSKKTVLVYDFGLFSGIAERLGRSFGKVYYHVPWEDAYPRAGKALVGRGLPGVEKALEFWPLVDKVDLIFFPDTHCSALARHLKDLGYPVAAALEAESLELDRAFGRQVQKEMGLDYQKTDRVIGVSNLLKYLADYPDGGKYVKIDIFRGEVETFQHIDLPTSKGILDVFTADMGPAAETIPFLVEEKVSGVEGGLDTIVWDGETLSPTWFSYLDENAYIAKTMDFKEVPDPFRKVHEGLAPVFRKWGTKFFFSTEIIYGKSHSKAYLIDYTLRNANPCISTLQAEVIKNFPELIWAMGTGERVDPWIEAPYCGSVILNSRWFINNWGHVKVDPSVKPFVTFRFHYRDKDGEPYRLPGYSSMVAFALAWGDSVEEVIALLEERQAKVSFPCQEKSFPRDEIMKGLAAFEKEGIEF